jgi:hypothetical protein
VLKGRPQSTTRSGARTKLVLNIAPVEFADCEIEVGVLPYEGQEQLAQLRAVHDPTHVFRRDSATEILAVPYVTGAPRIGDTFRKVRLGENLDLCAALVRNALVNTLHRMPRKVFRHRPVVFLSDEAKDNFLKECVPAGTPCPNWLAVVPLYEVEVRVYHFEDKEPFVGFCLNVRTRKFIDRPCRELMAEGFPLVGHYVGPKAESSDSRLQSCFCLQGRVQAVEGNNLVLDDCRQGEDRLDAGEAFLEPKWRAFDAVVKHVFKKQAQTILNGLAGKLATHRHGPERLKKLRAICAHFNKNPLTVVPGVSCRPLQLLAQGSDPAFPVIEQPPPVVYVFDQAGEKSGANRDQGIDDFGPYTAKTLSPSKPRFCVICQSGHKGRVEQFVRKFLEGITIHGQGRNPFGKGFIRKYAFKDVLLVFFEAGDSSVATYRRAINNALVAQRDQGITFNLALVETEERFKQLHGGSNPYLVCKAEFMGHQIPVQGFKFDTAQLPDSRLQYALNNMGLATYAKLNGVPWVIKVHKPIAHELVIGLGSANIGEGRLGGRERLVGITTVFTSDGLYCVSNLSQAVPFGDYEAEVLASLNRTIQHLARTMNWQEREHVRLVFHAFKPFRRAEEDAVKELMKSLGNYSVDYAFLHVVEQHPQMLFDEQQQGRSCGAAGKKGVFAAQRGLHLRLSEREVLLALKGPNEVKRPVDGIPKPLLLRLGSGSDFTDMEYLARQVYTFSCHSWRTFFPASLPVTIMYSELIARLLGKLSTVPSWNQSSLLGRIGTTRWFL